MATVQRFASEHKTIILGSLNLSVYWVHFFLGGGHFTNVLLKALWAIFRAFLGFYFFRGRALKKDPKNAPENDQGRGKFFRHTIDNISGLFRAV